MCIQVEKKSEKRKGDIKRTKKQDRKVEVVKEKH